MLQLPLLDIPLRMKQQVDEKTKVWDPIRKRWIVMTPEEHVRQLLMGYLTTVADYPAGKVGIEKKVSVGGLSRRYDAVIYDAKHYPWMLIECKAPEVPINHNTLMQLLAYHQQLQCRYWLLSNGHKNYCADASDVNAIVWLKELPQYG